MSLQIILLKDIVFSHPVLRAFKQFFFQCVSDTQESIVFFSLKKNRVVIFEYSQWTMIGERWRSALLFHFESVPTPLSRRLEWNVW